MFQPLEKSSVLIDAINEMVFKGVTDIGLAKVRRELAGLDKAGMVVDSLQIKGMIAALTGDIDEANRRFSSAATASGRQPTIVLNHAAAMSNLHCYTEAVDLLGEVIAKDPDNPKALHQALEIHLDALDVAGARDVFRRLNALGLATDKEVVHLKEVEIKNTLLDKAGVTWHEVAERIKLAIATLHNLGLNPRVLHNLKCEDGLLYQCAIDADQSTLASAEEAIHEAIAMTPYSPVDSIVSFSCVTPV